VSFIALVLLLLGLFFPKGGEFTRFINKLGFVYLFLNLIQTRNDVIARHGVYDVSQHFDGSDS